MRIHDHVQLCHDNINQQNLSFSDHKNIKPSKLTILMVYSKIPFVVPTCCQSWKIFDCGFKFTQVYVSLLQHVYLCH